MIAVLLAAVLQGAVPIRTLDKGMVSQLDDARQATAATTGEWAALWSRHAGERARPTVDFSREMVAAAFLGRRETAGFSIEIVGAREEGNALVVQYREAGPPTGALTAQVLTSPYHIVAVPKHASVRWEKVN